MQGNGAPLRYTDGYRTSVLSLLVLAFTCNFIDRTIIATIGQSIKVDLGLTDAELGWLGELPMIAGITVASFATYGIAQYAPAYFVRMFGLGLTNVGLVIGLVAGVSHSACALLRWPCSCSFLTWSASASARHSAEGASTCSRRRHSPPATQVISSRSVPAAWEPRRLYGDRKSVV